MAKTTDEVLRDAADAAQKVLPSAEKEVEAALDKRASMGALGDAQRYMQFQAADALRDAAQNEGGGAGLGAGLGAGFDGGVSATGCGQRCHRARGLRRTWPGGFPQERKWNVPGIARRTKTSRAKRSCRY